MAEFTRSGRPRLDKERLPFFRPTATITSRARRLYRGLLTVLSSSSLPRLPQLRGIQGKPPKSSAGKRKEHAGGSTVRRSAARASPQRWAMEGWRAGHSERWRPIRTLPGPWTLLWPSPKSRAQAPPTRLYPQTSLPAHLIQQVQPAEKSQAKSRSPLFLGATL